MRPFPLLHNDEEAEDFAVNVDLTEYDPSEMVVLRFERTDEPDAVVLPASLLAASRERTAHLGVPLDIFVRSAIERALAAE